MNLKNHLFIQPWSVLLKAFLVLSVLFFSFKTYAQNTINKAISAKDISEIVVDGNQIFNIEVEARPSKEIIINSLTDGEYQNEYKIHSEIKDGQLFIKLQKTPLYNIPDDKRNAHKVVAATLKVVMPEGLNIAIKSDIGSVNALGKFKTISIELLQGSVNVIGFAERAMINTFDGNICVTTENATIEAVSNNGKITVPKERFKNAYWILKSIDGDIKVVKPN
ncbi:hypothetical protein [Winogradskyella sp. A3E31]|uniref:hypothetical protein n=1 Tax=Winogradskyella sp. A3E31 TaxID=3349637 RepID=UPI00398AF83E